MLFYYMFWKARLEIWVIRLDRSCSCTDEAMGASPGWPLGTLASPCFQLNRNLSSIVKSLKINQSTYHLIKWTSNHLIKSSYHVNLIGESGKFYTSKVMMACWGYDVYFIHLWSNVAVEVDLTCTRLKWVYWCCAGFVLLLFMWFVSN